MKKIFTIFVFAILLSNVFISNALALTADEAEPVLVEKGITMEELQDMLEYYEYPLEDFETTEELSAFIGTPITTESLDQFLTEYGMTREELDALLEEYGTSVEEQWSIEDIQIALDFYTDHDSEIAELEEFLDAIGLTEEEIHKLFAHFEALDQITLEEQMEQISTRLEEFLILDPEAEPTEEQINELISVWEDMMSILNVSPKFYLMNAGEEKRAISFRELTAMDDLTSDALLIELYTASGELLLDMSVSDEMLSGDFAINAGEKIVEIGDIAGELTKLRHERLPDTASPYGNNILLGLFIVSLGIALLIIRNNLLNQEK